MYLNIRSCLLLIFSIVILLNFIIFLLLSKYTHLDANIINKTTPISPKHLLRVFNITNPGDVIVFLHMQKTGGSHFEEDLVRNIVNHSCPGQLIKLPNKHELVWRQHKCHKQGTVENWVFTRRTVGWPCGVHADYTALKICVPKYLSSLGYTNLNLFYITSLRDPVRRFISEYLHVKRGAYWSVYAIDCSLANKTQFIPGVFRETVQPRCEFFGFDKESITMEDFLNCDNNPAINRMTRMLAGYDTSECPPNSILSTQDMEQEVLKTAKYNLEHMAYFGILEYIHESYQLFENIFSVNFVNYPDFKNSASESLSLTSQQLQAIKTVNHLDLDLYNWAIRLLKDRIKNLRNYKL